MGDLHPFADVDDVISDYGVIGSVDDEDRVRTWIDALSTRLRLIGRKRGVDVDLLVNSDPLCREGARGAVVAAVRRRLQNPEAYRQVTDSETTGPLSESRSVTLDATVSGGGMNFLTDDLLWMPKPSKRIIRSFTIRSGY